MRTRRSQFSSHPVSSALHRSVLLHEVLEALAIEPDDVVLDATLGGGGHAQALAKQLGKKGILIGLDLDREAIKRTRARLAHTNPTTYLVGANFKNLDAVCAAHGITHITKALFDLGWSSYQLDSGRGFSFKRDEPLLMTYSATPGTLTASVAVNEWKEESLADVIFGFGEERYARRIAKAIVASRARNPIQTSRELAEIVKAAVPAPYRYGRIHPATRTFQALRIAINDELDALTQGLQAAWRTLAPGGRLAVITFHSIEDRIVKRAFLSWEKSGEGMRMPRKPIAPGSREIASNPRARSAKLRVIRKTIHHGQTATKNKQIQTLDFPG